jgi:hypothetical protein
VSRAAWGGLLAAGLLAVMATTWLLMQAFEQHEQARAARPLLALPFEHEDHGKLPCTQCHHNFIDGSGGGSCLLCHKSSLALSPHLARDFHGFCQGCHLEQALVGAASGPLRSCSGCHPRDGAALHGSARQ